MNGTTQKTLSNDSNYIVDLVMWPKFGNSSISMIQVIITSISVDLTRKINFLWGGLDFSSIYKRG